MLIDELRRKSISTKMQHYKEFFPRKIYSYQMVKKIKDDLFEIIRLPYANLSMNTYLCVTSLLYIVVYIIAIGISVSPDTTL